MRTTAGAYNLLAGTSFLAILEYPRQLKGESIHASACAQAPLLLAWGTVASGVSLRASSMQITCDNALDLTVPGQKYTFGVVQAAQARGDFHILAERGKRNAAWTRGEGCPSGASRAASGCTAGVDPKWSPTLGNLAVMPGSGWKE